MSLFVNSKGGGVDPEPFKRALNLATSVKFLDDLREVSLLNVIDGTSVYVEYHTRVGDKGGGLFIWDSSFVGDYTDDDFDNPADPTGPPLSVPNGPTNFDNNGTFIKPSSIAAPAAGRWRRFDSLTSYNDFHADWFGAYAYVNGGAATTGGIDSTDAIQAAHDAIKIDPNGGFRRSVADIDLTDNPRAFKYFRRGRVFLGVGAYLISDTLEFSGSAQLIGPGLSACSITLANSSFPLVATDYSDPAEERWQLRFSMPANIDPNNAFHTVVQGVFFYGNRANGNGAASNIFILGAEGSQIRDCGWGDCGFRGIYNPYGVPIVGYCLMNGVNRGPGLDMKGGSGPGTYIDKLSFSGVNQSGLYEDPLTGELYPGVLLRDVSHGMPIKWLQFEANPVHLVMSNCIGVKIDRFVGNHTHGASVNGYDTYGILLANDSHDNYAFPPIETIFGLYPARRIWDASITAGMLNKVGEVEPRIVPSPPPITVTAVGNDNGTPGAAVVTRKAQSRGWYVARTGVAAATSNTTITITGTQWEWTGMDLNYAASYSGIVTSVGGVLARLVVARASSNGTSLRVQKWLVIGKGSLLYLVADGADLTFGGSPPPAVAASADAVTDATGIITLVATHTTTDTTAISINLEIL